MYVTLGDACQPLPCQRRDIRGPASHSMDSTEPGLSRCLRGDAGLKCGGWDRTGVGNVGRLHTPVSDIKATEVIQSESLAIGSCQEACLLPCSIPRWVRPFTACLEESMFGSSGAFNMEPFHTDSPTRNPRRHFRGRSTAPTTGMQHTGTFIVQAVNPSSPRCPQNHVDFRHLLRIPQDEEIPAQDEDEFRCLNLEVTSPALKTLPERPCPVLMWIHGKAAQQIGSPNAHSV